MELTLTNLGSHFIFHGIVQSGKDMKMSHRYIDIYMYVSLQNLHSFGIGVEMEVLPLSNCAELCIPKKICLNGFLYSLVIYNLFDSWAAFWYFFECKYLQMHVCVSLFVCQKAIYVLYMFKCLPNVQWAWLSKRMAHRKYLRGTIELSTLWFSLRISWNI